MSEAWIKFELEINCLAEGGINDIVNYAKHIGLFFQYVKTGGLFRRTYSCFAQGEPEKIKAFRNYLSTATGQWL